MFNLKEEPYDMYINMLFIDLSNVSKNVFRAIRGGIGNLTYEISISHKKARKHFSFIRRTKMVLPLNCQRFMLKSIQTNRVMTFTAVAIRLTKVVKVLNELFQCHMPKIYTRVASV